MAVNGAALIATLAEQVELLAVQSQAGYTAEKLAQSADSLKDEFLAAIARLTSAVTRAERIQLTKLLADSQFTSLHRNDMLAAIAETVGTSPVSGLVEGQAPRQQLQKFAQFSNYPSKPLAKFVADASTPYRHKLFGFGKLLMDLGATNLNEPSLCDVIATWFALENITDLDPSTAYSRLQDLKSYLHSYRDKVRAPHFGKITHYPSEPT